ncbi:MAG: type II toxin-antitoxin system RatA family toxin [Magnetococcales bacterium]|nr:type II toxin-antitoxin system RatA family toxin [Magnetococcales bacterium]MBF0584481.1 type II toxin-antitoxin system RatA family toxin [Magnetococcales bacterium]
MSRHSATTIVPFTPEQMYLLVIDMDRYPEFLPWCTKARKYECEESGFKSEITFSFKGIRETFYTLDQTEPGRKIHITLASGPFRHLESEWLFTPVEGGTRIDFYIDFSFKNKLVDITLGPVFGEASRRMVEAFKHRAETLYRDEAAHSPSG